MDTVDTITDDEQENESNEIEIVDVTEPVYTALFEIIQNYAKTTAITIANKTNIEPYLSTEDVIANDILAAVKNMKNVLSKDTYNLLVEIYTSEDILEDLMYTRIFYYYVATKYGQLFEEEE